jgi:hypothetical protein
MNHHGEPAPDFSLTEPSTSVELMLCFESLGYTCEFGMVQRLIGAEPFGLLRFAGIKHHHVVRGLRCGFRGLGEPGSVTIGTWPNLDTGEMIGRVPEYGMWFHTFRQKGEIDADRLRIQQEARLRFLKRKLLEDIASAEKIFVVRRSPEASPELSLQEALELHGALRDRGPCWLLWMRLADDAHPSGSVEVMKDGLLAGRVDKFAARGNMNNPSVASWLAVCETARRVVGNVSASCPVPVLDGI